MEFFVFIHHTLDLFHIWWSICNNTGDTQQHIPRANHGNLIVRSVPRVGFLIVRDVTWAGIFDHTKELFDHLHLNLNLGGDSDQ